MLGSILGGLATGLLGAATSKSNKPQQQTINPWPEAVPYLMGQEGEQRLREGVEPVYSEGSPLMSYEEWAQNTPGVNMGDLDGNNNQRKYEQYKQNHQAGGQLLNPQSDFETVGGTTGLLPEAQRLYDEGGLTPEQQQLNEQFTNQIQHQYDSMGNSVMNNSNELYTNMLNGEFVPDRQGPAQITPQTIQAAENTFQPNAQAQEWQAETVDPNSVQTMQSAQLGPAAQISSSNMPKAASVGNVAQMQAAQNQGYTPTGQVADFMNGEAYNNRFLDSQIDSASRKFGQQFKENILSGITDGAVSTGGLGGSRQGIAEGIAARGAADAMGDMIGGMRSNAYNQGFGAMSNLTSQQMAGGINQAAQNAGLNQQANAQNTGWQNQGIFQDASNQQSANNLGFQGALANMNATNQFGLAQAGMDQQANAANAGYGNQAIFGNQGYQNSANAGNAGANNQFGLANQNLGFGAATQNAGYQQQANIGNVANDLNAQNANVNNTFRDNAQGLQFGQTNLQNQMGANGVLGQGLLTNTAMYDTLMGGYGAGQNADWGNLNNLGNIILPAAGLGQTGTRQQSTNPLAAGIGGAMAGFNMFGGLGNNSFGGWNMQGQQQPLLNNSAFVGNM